jgi:hypothetical protein
MTAYLAGRGGLSLLRLQTIILTFSSPKNLKRYTKIESFQSGTIRALAEYEGEPVPLLEEIDLNELRVTLHISEALVQDITEVQLEVV